VTDFDEADHWATDDLSMTDPQRQELARQAFAIENYHRALKQCRAVEKCQARSAVAQKNHILLSLRTFVRLEVARMRTGKSCYETKLEIIREAVRNFCRSGERAQSNYRVTPKQFGGEQSIPARRPSSKRKLAYN
jgi:putative transposase